MGSASTVQLLVAAGIVVVVVVPFVAAFADCKELDPASVASALVEFHKDSAFVGLVVGTLD